MKTKRIPCPHCGEPILPTAKKCRYCKERLDSKQPGFRSLYLMWLLSVVIFFLSLFFVRRIDVSTSTWSVILGLLGLNVLGGTIAYLMLIIKIFSSFKSKNAKLYGLASLLTFFMFFGLLFNLDGVEAKLGFAPPEFKQTISTTPTPIPLSSPSTVPKSKTTQQKAITTTNNTSSQITCTGPDGKTFQTTQEECDAFNKAWGNEPTPNPNEIVRCNIHPDCGGGYKEMTRSSCEQMTCCLTDVNGTPKFTSKSECSRQVNQNCINQVYDTYSQDVQFCNEHIGQDMGYDCMESANRLRDELMAICNQ